MKDQEFDHIIAGVKHVSLPSCSGSLESNVLRKIRLSRNDSEGSLWAWFTVLLPKPTFVAVSLALVISVSSGITVMATKTYTTAVHNHQMASSALDFGVFDQNVILNFDAS